MNVETLLSAIDELMHARAVLDASSNNEPMRDFERKIAAHVEAVEKLRKAAEEARASQISLAFYAAPVEKPKTMRRGLMNALQMAINVATQGDVRETVLKLVDIRADVASNANPYRIEGKA